MDFIKLVDSKISIEDVTTSVASSKCGATSVFIGTTRDNFEDKKVS
jgi:molybdopterin synthase catalytic subunit